MGKLLSVLLLVLLYVPSVFANNVILNEVSEAACRINSGSSYGSGTAVHDDGNSIYVLTNAHVVGNSRSVNVEFFKFGRKTLPMSGEVIWRKFARDTDVDFAIVKINKSYFGDYPPRIIPFAPDGHKLQNGDYIASAGCPEARWLAVWEGYVLQDANSRFYFTPPPLGGQSGSGLFTNIDNKVYIIGVITWRVGRSGRDMKGFPISRGGAIPIDKVKDLLNGVVEYNPIPSGYVEAGFVLAEDGKVYRKNSDGSVTLPRQGMRIIDWNYSPPSTTQPRPPGGLPPIPPPNGNGNTQPNPNNPYGKLPPNFGQSGSKGALDIAEEKYEELQKKYAQTQQELQALQEKYNKLEEAHVELQKRYEEVLQEKSSLEQQLADIKSELDQSKIQISNLTEELSESKITTEEYLKKVEEYSSTITQHEKAITELKTQIDTKTTELNTKSEEIDQVKKEKERLIERIKSYYTHVTQPGRNFVGYIKSNILNILSIILCIAVVIFLIYAYIKHIRPIIIDIKNGNGGDNTTVIVEDRSMTDNQGDTSLADSRVDLLEKRLDNLSKFVASKFEQITDLFKQKSDININIDNQDTNVNDGGADSSKDDDENANSSHHHHGHPFKDCLNYPVSDRIKQFLDLKAKDGEKLEDLAVYALLYGEAMNRLRKGIFTVDVNGNTVKLQGQKVTADKIDSWVREQYLKNMTINKLDRSRLYHEAMIGFLYKEAIRLLRQGFFPVLGAKETADVIEDWVRIEFMKRMGFST